LSNADPQVRILFVGDMHLGVLPSRIPSHLEESRQLGPRILGPGEAWLRVVDAAMEHQVHAVALAGDLVEGNNALFEAFGLLEKGLLRLEKAGIQVVAVAGNHDTEVLPRLVEIIKNLHLLGPGGTWSSIPIKGGGQFQIQLTGWSFPRPHVDISPLPAPAPDLRHPTFGLLHCDLNQSTSSYAPVSSQDLMATGYQGWFLGHIHRPGMPENQGHPFYLGSVTGLHPGETGLHGPVLVKIQPGEHFTAERLALAPLRWEKLIINCHDSTVENLDLPALLLHRIQNWARENASELGDTLAVGFRLTLSGSLADPAPLRAAAHLMNSRKEDLITDHQNTVLFIENIINETTLTLDLQTLARDRNPEGLLARRILVLENRKATVPGVDDPESLHQDLISSGRAVLSGIDNKSAYLPLNQDHQDLNIAAVMARAGHRALEEILQEKGADDEN